MEQKDHPVQERILDAAEKLFAEKGYKETTTREIVGEAGASLSSLQSHFQGKDNVYYEVRRRAINKLGQLIQPSIDEVRYLDQQGMLYGEAAWNLLYEIVAKYADWSFAPENEHTIMLVSREMLEGAPILGLPAETIEERFSVVQLLCERYAGTQGADWSILLGRIVLSTLLVLSGMRYKCDEIGAKDLRLDLSREELKYQVKSYLLLSMRAYLDIQKGRPLNCEDGLEGQIQPDRGKRAGGPPVP